MRFMILVGASALVLALGACNAGPPATKTAGQAPGGSPPSAASTSAAAPAAPGAAESASAATDPRDGPVPLATDGKPEWAANRKHTAAENADYQFNKNGKDFDAPTEAAYVAKVHAFVDTPPPTVEKISRSNGDALLYDARTNTFAVVSKTGAPRTMFKPRDGANYWREQVARESAKAKESSGGDSES